eukprot:c17926_g1_i1.p1 GENE.c17926_g1_i1~~c17926_g1_i1.p1  ORF type:complete len:301 (+),score=55.68 c17926_g1_i1:37-939(+)
MFVFVFLAFGVLGNTDNFSHSHATPSHASKHKHEPESGAEQPDELEAELLAQFGLDQIDEPETPKPTDSHQPSSTEQDFFWSLEQTEHAPNGRAPSHHKASAEDSKPEVHHADFGHDVDQLPTTHAEHTTHHSTNDQNSEVQYKTSPRDETELPSETKRVEKAHKPARAQTHKPSADQGSEDNTPSVPNDATEPREPEEATHTAVKAGSQSQQHHSDFLTNHSNIFPEDDEYDDQEAPPLRPSKKSDGVGELIDFLAMPAPSTPSLLARGGEEGAVVRSAGAIVTNEPNTAWADWDAEQW